MLTGLWGARKLRMPTPEEALPGRAEAIDPGPAHRVHGRPLQPPMPSGIEEIVFGMGCFWGAERVFWREPGVYSTAVGYAGGYTPNPTYDEVCSGATGHAEVVRVFHDPQAAPLEMLLRRFWEEHDPTQGMQQGNDRGTQYRSVIHTVNDEQLALARQSLETYQKRLHEQGLGDITTEIRPLDRFYYAEDWHQQYLHQNPDGYCGLKGLGIQAG
ncbi:MAG: peptide-methionine (S)-S-oxide reductase MsrA [Pseudomonadota bacterium]